MVVAVLVASAMAAACGSTPDEPSHASSDELSCLSRLRPHCCTLQKRRGDKCVEEFRLAERCTSWPEGTTLIVHAEPCGGFRAIRVIGASYSTFFVYDAANDELVAVADNAASAPGTNDIGCGAGPAGFFVPPECSPGWLDGSKGQACDETTGELPLQPWCSDASP
jgi:hypothetical protein